MEVTAHKGTGPLQQVLGIGRHQLLSDAPAAFGGEDSGPEPHDLLAAALAACTALTVTMYARRKGMPLEDVRVRIGHAQQDGAYLFQRHIEYVGDLSAEDRARLTDIANKCPVHKTLSGTIRIETEAF
ncbi:OsmC family protein [Massilia sp. G4R7]|uniref:OsmC family protein n=1 Tax=Massilia phyllostachyos TaxID=2898585 RepID=A0ABS8QBJ6_9BURK|nr:OsmC family protein [Massilia phyllostachyos]MCD2519089.1 OsmC family protein [Massilia phyllostachyos]